MTLVIALANEKEAVLVADSLCRFECDGVWYKESEKFKKIHPTINPKIIVGIAGQSSAVGLLHRVIERQRASGVPLENADFDSVLRSTRHFLEEIYVKESDIDFGSPLSFLFAGIHNEKPAIALVRCFVADKGREVSPAGLCGSWKAIGVEPHGALYVLFRAMQRNMSTEQLIAIASYCALETSEQDSSVDSRLQIAVVKQSGVGYVAINAAGLCELKKRSATTNDIITNSLPSDTLMPPT